MNTDFPIPITTDDDLNFYDDYLKREFTPQKSETFIQKLTALIGNPIKAECVMCNRIDARIGRLLEVGEDFILINHPNTNQKTIIPISTVKSVTLLKNSTENLYL